MTWSYPARIRTWIKRTKISCATVTLPGKRFSGAPSAGRILGVSFFICIDRNPAEKTEKTQEEPRKFCFPFWQLMKRIN
jgi:hypothetical protein